MSKSPGNASTWSIATDRWTASWCRSSASPPFGGRCANLSVGPAAKPFNDLIAGHHVTELLNHVLQRRAMLVVGQRRATVGHHHHFEVEHHGIACGRFAANVGLGAGNENG